MVEAFITPKKTYFITHITSINIILLREISIFKNALNTFVHFISTTGLYKAVWLGLALKGRADRFYKSAPYVCVQKHHMTNLLTMVTSIDVIGEHPNKKKQCYNMHNKQSWKLVFFIYNVGEIFKKIVKKN